MTQHLGYGIGLRSTHFERVLRDAPPIDFFEILSDNFLDSHGWPRFVLDRVAERYPIVMHGVSLSIGGSDVLDVDYLRRLKSLGDAVGARWISDHLCWTGFGGATTHDLLPLPLNDESLRHVAERVRIAQDVLERPLVLENPSSYLRFDSDTISECDFLRMLTEETNCQLLLDVNNVYVSSVNHRFDPFAYIDAIPSSSVVQYHLAGHTNHGTHIIDTHDGPVVDAVWELYRYAVRVVGERSTLIEWDAKIPSLDVVHAEALAARQWAEAA